MNAQPEEIASIDGFGEIGAEKVHAFFANEENRRVTQELLKELKLIREEQTENTPLAGKTVVITGSLKHFENRDALAAEIIRQGGRVSGSVSSKTSYLINNDVTSTSGKNKKAKELGIPILSEEDLMAMF